MRILTTSALLVSSLTLTGCMTSGDTKSASSLLPPPAEKCFYTFKKEYEAPKWYCGKKVDGVARQSKGCSNVVLKRKQEQFAINQAQQNLAQLLQTDMKVLIEDFYRETGVNKPDAVEAVIESISKALSVVALKNMDMIDTIPQTPTGETCVLLGINPEAKSETFKKAIKTSRNNDEALYQQFTAFKGHQKLEEEVAKKALTQQ